MLINSPIPTYFAINIYIKSLKNVREFSIYTIKYYKNTISNSSHILASVSRISIKSN